jgi:hypothetical protein
MNAWNVQGSIQRKVSVLGLDRLGESALWGGFSDVKDGWSPGSNPSISQFSGEGALGATGPNMELKAFTFPGIDVTTQITGTDVNTWFIRPISRSKRPPCISIWPTSTSKPTSI